MPLVFDTITNKSPPKCSLVFDIGRSYTKCGFGGDHSPTNIVRTLVKVSSDKQVTCLHDITEETELYEKLKEFLNYLCFTCLLVSPAERPIVICESIYCSILFRNTLARLLFKHFQVTSVLFVPQSLSALMTLARNSGLVVDVGYNETLVIPVYAGIHEMKAVHSAPLAARALHRNIEVMLRESATVSMATGKILPFSEVFEHTEEKILEDIKVRCCFVTNLERAKKNFNAALSGVKDDMPDPPPDMKYPVEGNMIINVPGIVREQACEVFFERDNDETSIATLILDTLVACPIDMRRPLMENILVIGGSANPPGFYPRLLTELYDLLDKPKYKQYLVVKQFCFHQAPAKENYTAWLGGAIFGDLENLSRKSLKAEQYLQTEKLPDWCNLTKEFDEFFTKPPPPLPSPKFKKKQKH